MSSQNSPHTFPRSVTWLGVLILSSALATLGQSPAHAATGVLSTSSMTWTNLSNEGVLTGGLPVDYASSQGGWGPEAFDSVGVMGIEWTTPADPTRRNAYIAPTATPVVNPGGESSISSFSFLSPKPAQVLATTASTRISGDQAQWSIQLKSTAPDAMTGNRFFWIADLPGGYDSVFNTVNPNTLLVSDSQGVHPTVVMYATTTAGTLVWGGNSTYTAPLLNGENKPTMYVHSTSEMDITITVTVGIIDHDPCSGSEALALGGASVGVYGTPIETLTGCLKEPVWGPVEAGSGPGTLTLELDPRTPALAEHESRVVTISGLPEGVTWTPATYSNSMLAIDLVAERTVSPGEYPLEFNVLTRSDLNSVVSFSQPLHIAGTLTILAATPLPEPEPEIAQEPELVPFEDGEPEEVTPVLISDTPAGGQSQSSTGQTQELRQALEVEPASAGAPPLKPEPVRETPGSNYVPSTPAERELFSPELRIQRSAEEVPTPSNASAWLGLSLAIAAGLSGIFALLRRVRYEEQE